MSKKQGLLVVFAAVMLLFLAACGSESQEDVVGTLQDKVDSMEGYQAQADMHMNTGESEQNFKIDILHKQKDNYRVQLHNDQEEQGNQIILKNDEGVFVLTPELDKSFKFQSDWPQNSSQPYLYQSLVNDILKDDEAEFQTTEKHYKFKTKTNYQSNNNLPYQEIYFDKQSYAPALVKVLDKDDNAMVEVKFSNFEMDPEFSEEDFVLEDNMGNKDDKDGEEDKEKDKEDDDNGEDNGNEEDQGDKEDEQDENVSASGEGQDQTFGVLFPLYMAGSEMAEKKEVDLEDGKRVIMNFTGDKNFTLVEEKQQSVKASSAPKEVSGDIVNLGHSIGAVSDSSLEWTKNGVDFYLASEDLTRGELIEVAKSVTGKEIK